jgi:uncharacterized LabA/DUF88 family protein
VSVRACVFVDGENFRLSIVQLFESFRREDYLPKAANWASLFDWLVAQAALGGERIRTYWYVMQSIDFWPYDFPNVTKEADKLHRLLAIHTPYKEELDNLSSAQQRVTRMGQIVKEMEDRREKMTKSFDGWIKIQNGIATRQDAVEFRRAGSIWYDLFRDSMGQEKAAGVKMAVDLITLRDNYDMAVIVSGDQDYVPAVQVIKDFGKRVINVAFETRDGQLLPGGARRLNQLADRGLTVSYKELGKYLGL